MSQILYGAPVAEQIEEKIKNNLPENGVTLATFGFSSPQWLQYTSSLKKHGEKLGIHVENVVCDGMNPKEFSLAVDSTSHGENIHGAIVQQPLPKGYQDCVNCLCSQKDLDCLSPISVAKLYHGEPCLLPATPLAVLKLLDFYGIDLQSKNVTVVGRGAVGKPLALMMLKHNATVTICHSKTTNLPEMCRQADIIVSACGCCGLITTECVTPNSVVIDVGLNFSDGKTLGDVSAEVLNIVSAYSPVPSGVGPVTRMTLFENLLKAVGALPPSD